MLKIYNTLTHTKEEFIPIHEGTVTMYNCGLTVYDYPQIGNLRAYTMADTIRRSLEFMGYEVQQVMNWTDVGHLTFTDEQKKKLEGVEVLDADMGLDRMEKAAKREGKTVWEVAQFYIDHAMEDFRKMNFLEPSARPRASEYIQAQIDIIARLLDKGLAYVTPSAIYFDTSKFPEYGKLTGQSLLEKKVGAREEVEIDENKKNPYDFRLWQLDQPDHAQQWESPWGKGFPGWHLECSAMIHELLGEPIDIHTGGVDHIPVHHTNEIAQSEGAFGVPLAHYWYHNEFLLVDGKRMGKSLGNAYTLADIEERGYEPLDLRYFYLTANFRAQQNFTFEALGAARTARQKLIHTYQSIVSGYLENQVPSPAYTEAVKRFKEAIEDSFNMPNALAQIWEAREKLDDSDYAKFIQYTDLYTGLEIATTKITPIAIPAEVQELVEKRTQAKSEKNYALSDSIRQEILAKGFEIKDTPEGPVVTKQ